MEASRLIGPRGEQLVLCTCIMPLSMKLSQWLSAVERTMKTSVQLALEACLQARLDGTLALSQISQLIH